MAAKIGKWVVFLGVWWLGVVLLAGSAIAQVDIGVSKTRTWYREILLNDVERWNQAMGVYAANWDGLFNVWLDLNLKRADPYFWASRQVYTLISQSRGIYINVEAYRAALDAGRPADAVKYKAVVQKAATALKQNFYKDGGKNDGYVWGLDASKTQKFEIKQAYGHVHSIFSLAHAYTVTLDSAHLAASLDVMRKFERDFVDNAHPGAYKGSFDPAGVEPPDPKNLDYELHYFEALLALYDVLFAKDANSGRPTYAHPLNTAEQRAAVRQKIIDVGNFMLGTDADANAKKMFNVINRTDDQYSGYVAFYYDDNWVPSQDPKSESATPGHSIELAYLLSRAIERGLETDCACGVTWGERANQLISFVRRYGSQHSLSNKYYGQRCEYVNYDGSRRGDCMDTEPLWWQQSENFRAHVNFNVLKDVTGVGKGVDPTELAQSVQAAERLMLDGMIDFDPSTARTESSSRGWYQRPRFADQNNDWIFSGTREIRNNGQLKGQIWKVEYHTAMLYAEVRRLYDWKAATNHPPVAVIRGQRRYTTHSGWLPYPVSLHLQADGSFDPDNHPLIYEWLDGETFAPVGTGPDLYLSEMVFAGAPKITKKVVLKVTDSLGKVAFDEALLEVMAAEWGWGYGTTAFKQYPDPDPKMGTVDLDTKLVLSDQNANNAKAVYIKVDLRTLLTQVTGAYFEFWGSWKNTSWGSGSPGDTTISLYHVELVGGDDSWKPDQPNHIACCPKEQGRTLLKQWRTRNGSTFEDFHFGCNVTDIVKEQLKGDKKITFVIESEGPLTTVLHMSHNQKFPKVVAGDFGTAPVAYAGAPQYFAATGTYPIAGTARDDTPGLLVPLWTKTSGAGTVTFSNPNAFSTQVTFAPDVSGSVELELSVSDGQGLGKDAVTHYVGETDSVPQFTTQTLPRGRLNQPYSAQLTHSGGNGGVWVEGYQGTLPPGLDLATDGRITGTPEQPGTFTFSAQAVDRDGDADRQQFSITIRPLGSVSGGKPKGLFGSGMQDDTVTPRGEWRKAEFFYGLRGIDEIKTMRDACGGERIYAIGWHDNDVAEYLMEFGGEYSRLTLRGIADRPGPYVEVEVWIDGERKARARWNHADNCPQDVTVRIPGIAYGIHAIAVKFVNDRWRPGPWNPETDRNMFLAGLRVSR